jgi:hypothetical protein
MREMVGDRAVVLRSLPTQIKASPLPQFSLPYLADITLQSLFRMTELTATAA